jgi:hypothetical protein
LHHYEGDIGSGWDRTEQRLQRCNTVGRRADPGEFRLLKNYPLPDGFAQPCPWAAPPPLRERHASVPSLPAARSRDGFFGVEPGTGPLRFIAEVGMNKASELRQKARSFRRLLRLISDNQTVRAILQVSRELEMTAERLERQETIRKRAYELWIEQDRPQNRDIEIWLAAERELIDRGKIDAGG